MKRRSYHETTSLEVKSSTGRYSSPGAQRLFAESHSALLDPIVSKKLRKESKRRISVRETAVTESDIVRSMSYACLHLQLEIQQSLLLLLTTSSRRSRTSKRHRIEEPVKTCYSLLLFWLSLFETLAGSTMSCTKTRTTTRTNTTQANVKIRTYENISCDIHMKTYHAIFLRS
jgi:hypothetical protein